MKQIFILTIASMTIISCGQSDPNKEIDEGKVAGEFYTSNEIGWTIAIPEGWEVISKNKRNEDRQKAKEAIEEVYEGAPDMHGLRNLISFQKNPPNIFSSTTEPFELEYEGEWEVNYIGIKKLLYDTYTNQGIKIDTSSAREAIDNLNFEVFNITIYGPKGDIILHQIMYSRLINGFQFGVNINYNNETDKEIMINSWRNSKFKKK